MDNYEVGNDIEFSTGSITGAQAGQNGFALIDDVTKLQQT
jgi:hypothetical protein